MPYLGSVNFEFPVDWIDARRPLAGANYTSINGEMTTQKILDTSQVYKPITLKLSWINHSQYETLYTYYNSTTVYTLQIAPSGSTYSVVFQSGADAFEFTPVVPEIPYSYRSLSAHTLTGSYYDGTIKLICLGVSGG
jgi:hypothetical protein